MSGVETAGERDEANVEVVWFLVSVPVPVVVPDVLLDPVLEFLSTAAPCPCTNRDPSLSVDNRRTNPLRPEASISSLDGIALKSDCGGARLLVFGVGIDTG